MTVGVYPGWLEDDLWASPTPPGLTEEEREMRSRTFLLQSTRSPSYVGPVEYGPPDDDLPY